MKLTVIQEDPIHGYPLDSVLVIKPILNESLDTIYFNVYENNAKYQEYISGSFNSLFNTIRSDYERIDTTLRSRLIGELPITPKTVLLQTMEILYSELTSLPKYSSTYWSFDNSAPIV